MQQPSYTFVFRNESRPLVRATRWTLIILKVVLIVVVAVIQVPLWWLLGIVLAAVSLIEYRALKTVAKVQFTDEGLVFTTMFKKQFRWQQIENVIIKDELLTVDFKNNRLLQKEIDTPVDEQQFNTWCAAKLKFQTEN